MIKWFEGLHAVNLQQSRVTGSSTSSLCNASWDGEPSSRFRRPRQAVPTMSSIASKLRGEIGDEGDGTA
jgi:hypothetical protein